MGDGPETYVIKPSEDAAAEYQARLAQDRAEARRRYVAYLAPLLAAIDAVGAAEERAAAIIDALTIWTSVTSGEPCHCSCHPSLPGSDLHEFGFACGCRSSAEERRRSWDKWEAERDEYWASSEGQAIIAARRAEEEELEAWLTGQSGVELRSHGGWAPEQWQGAVDGHSFYFRERHDIWRIELDLKGTGRFARVWLGGHFDNEANFKSREIEEGEVIAEGTINADGYGTTPVERARFIFGVIRSHLS